LSQKYFCHKNLFATKNFCQKINFVTNKFLSQKKFCQKKFLPQNIFCLKKMFVTTKSLSQKRFCHKIVVTKKCHKKIVVTKKLVSPKAVCHKNSSVIEIFPSLEFASVRSLLFSSLSSLFRMFETSERPAKGPGSAGEPKGRRFANQRNSGTRQNQRKLTLWGFKFSSS
jgi:hypothetical protein